MMILIFFWLGEWFVVEESAWLGWSLSAESFLFPGFEGNVFIGLYWIYKHLCFGTNFLVVYNCEHTVFPLTKISLMDLDMWKLNSVTIGDTVTFEYILVLSCFLQMYTHLSARREGAKLHDFRSEVCISLCKAESLNRNFSKQNEIEECNILIRILD